jgi:chitinase
MVLPPPLTQPAPTPTNNPPVASFTVSCPSQKNNCSFDASGSRDDSGIARYSWSFGDGASNISAANPIATHTYRSKGTFTVTLTVADDAGLTSLVQKSVTVKSVMRN